MFPPSSRPSVTDGNTANRSQEKLAMTNHWSYWPQFYSILDYGFYIEINLAAETKGRGGRPEGAYGSRPRTIDHFQIIHDTTTAASTASTPSHVFLHDNYFLQQQNCNTTIPQK